MAACIFFAADSRGFLRGEIAEPELAEGTAGPISHHYGVSDAVAVGRKGDVGDGTEAGEVGARQPLR